MTVNFTEVVTQMGVMLLIVAAGYAMRRFHWTDKSADGAFSQIIVRMTAPALVFYGVVGNREQLLSGNLPQVVLAVGVTVLIAGLLAGLVFRERSCMRNTAPCCASPPCSGMSHFWAFPFVMGCSARKA
jgi:predicted permease